MFSFYNDLSGMELLLFWVFISVFIFFVTYSIALRGKNKELIKLIHDMEDKSKEEFKQSDISEKKCDNEIVSIRSNNGIYQKNVLSSITKQTSPISIQNNVSYLEEAKKSLEKASSLEPIELTEYEQKEELEAIISYRELTKNKDRLYNITSEEEDGDFIQELKSFRNSL